MQIAIVIAVVALGFVLGTLKRRYNFGSRQEVLRLFNNLSRPLSDFANADIQVPVKPTHFKGLKLAR